MIHVYRGVDIAGDKSTCSGVVDLLKDDASESLSVRIPFDESDCSGFEGLKRIAVAGENEQLDSGAIDQPLGLPCSTYVLLQDGTPRDYSTDANSYRYRKADLSMRVQLKSKNLKIDYVRPPSVCDNIWRALLLVKLAGQQIVDARTGTSVWCETHPRLDIVGLVEASPRYVELVSRYKLKTAPRLSKEENQRRREDRIKAREDLLGIVAQYLRLKWVEGARSMIIGDDNRFEAFFCACTAYARKNELCRRFPIENLPCDIAEVEGYVFVTNWLAMKDRPQNG